MHYFKVYVALSACISALFGITEPALYGVTIQNKRALIGVMAGSFVGGVSIGLFGLAGFAAVGPGLASITMFVDADNSMNLVYAIIGIVISFFISFIAVLFLWKDDSTGNKMQKTSVTAEDQVLKSSVTAEDEASVTAEDELQKSLVTAKDELQKSLITAKDEPRNSLVTAEISTLMSPLTGHIVPLAQVNDAVFSQKVLGEGYCHQSRAG